jgi:hypothetical protein
MGEKIEFPKNFERYVDLGQEAMQREDFLKAIQYFSLAYAIESDFPLNFLLANTYFDIGEYEKALELSRDFLEDYYSHIEFFSFYIQILTMNKKFIEAHRQINSRIYNNHFNDIDVLLRMKKEVRRNELLYKQFERKKINELKSILLELPNLGFSEQMNKSKAMMNLPQEDFIELSSIFLKTREVHLLVRNWILEMLVHMSVHDELDVLLFNGTIKRLNPSELKLPYENESFLETVEALDILLGMVDPILLVNLMEEVRLFFAMLYPVADEVVSEPLLWAKSFVVDYSTDIEIPEISEAQNDSMEKIKKVKHILRNAV